MYAKMCPRNCTSFGPFRTLFWSRFGLHFRSSLGPFWGPAGSSPGMALVWFYNQFSPDQLPGGSQNDSKMGHGMGPKTVPQVGPECTRNALISEPSSDPFGNHLDTILGPICASLLGPKWIQDGF